MRIRSVAASLLAGLLSIPASAAITGSVMTADGTPVSGARVSTQALELPEARRARLLSASPERVPLESVQTDAKGAFTLPSPKNSVVELRIEAAGFEPQTQRVERDEDTGAITMTRRASRRGTVTAGGKPVANAVVFIVYAGGDFLTRTNEQGQYDAPEMRARSITVIHPDFALDEERFQDPRIGPGRMNRVLTAGKTVSGRVVASDGQSPVAGATVSVDEWPLATSAEDGSFTIGHAPAKWSMLTARKDSLLGQRTSNSVGKDAATVKLEKAGQVTGRITDAKTKLPVADVVVTLGSGRRSLTDGDPAGVTDAKGAFSVAIPPGSYIAFLSHPAYEMEFADVSVTSGQRVVKDLTIDPFGRVSGVVVDEEKRAVAGAAVTADRPGESFSFAPMRQVRRAGTITGPDGRFLIRLAPDTDFRLKATKKGLPVAQGETFRLAAAERKTGVMLTIATGIAVSGRVKDQNGEPLSGVAVAATETPGGERGMVMRMVIGAGFTGEEEDVVKTASDGTFTLRVKEGTYDFSFRREGYAPKQVRAQEVRATGAPEIETTLEPAVEITGRVTRGGMGIADVSINSFTDATTVTGPDGSFTLSGLAPGPVRLMLRKESEFIQDNRNATAPARDVVFEIPPGGRITGRVVEKGSRKPIPSFQAGISVSRGGGGMVMLAPPQLQAFTSDDGSFILENVPPGAKNLVASAPGYASGRMNVDVEEGKTVSDVVVELEPGVRLVGKVTGPNGSPLADATVQVQPSPTGSFARSGSLRRTATDSNGEYTLESLDPGEETFEISHPKHVATTKSVTLKGRETRMDVQLSGGQRVTGTVVTESGMPVADAEVEATVGMSGTSVLTNASGTFEFASLPPGRHRFTAAKAGYVDGTLEDVDISTTQNIRIQLGSGGTIYGQVTGLSEQELAGATVTARGGRATSSASVDPSGNFRIEGAPTGTVQISASTASRTFTTRRSTATQTIELEPGGSQQVTLEFRSDTVVRGRVTRNGVPLGGAMVVFQGSRSQASAATTADESGSYSVAGLEEGEYTVAVNDLQRFSPYSTKYVVRSGASTFDIDYKAGAVRGRVVDATSNEPIADATVQLRPQASSEFRTTRAAMTDAAGTFSIDSVSPGTYVITASREGFGNQMLEMTFGEAGRDELELRMSPNDGVALRVVDARDGRSVNAFVTVYDQAGRIVHENRNFMFNPTDSTSGIRLPLAPGSYVATVYTSGYAPQSAHLTSPSSATVALTPGGTLLVRSKHSERRRMQLLDGAGIPYPRIGFQPAVRDLLPGSMPLPNVAPGTYTLQLLNADGSVSASVQATVREGETTTVEL